MLGNRTEKSLATWSRMFHAIGATVTVVLVSATVLFVIRPMEDRVVQLQHRAEELSEALSIADEVKSEHELLTSQRLAADDKVEKLLDRIPNVPRESEFLGQITTLAREVGLSIVDYRPGSASERKDYKQMTLTLSSDGSYVSICSFLSRIHQLPRLSRVLNLDIEPTGNGDVYKMMMTLTIFFAPDSKLAAAHSEEDHV